MRHTVQIHHKYRFRRAYSGGYFKNALEYFDAEQLSSRLKREVEDLSWKLVVGGPTNQNAYDIPVLPQTTQVYLSCYLPEYDDMCFDYEDTIKIFSVQSSSKKVTAYSVKTLWSVQGFQPDGMKSQMKPLGITTDGRGHLFISDAANGCIQIFDTDGTYLCPVDCNSKLDLGTPKLIDLSKSESALVVTHKVNGKCFISVLKIPIQPT